MLNQKEKPFLHPPSGSLLQRVQARLTRELGMLLLILFYGIAPLQAAEAPVTSGLSHPRIFLGDGRLAALQQKAGYDANGNKLNNVTPSAAWTQFSGFMTNFRNSGTYYGMRAWPFALMYMITKDKAYYDRALAFLTEVMTAQPTGQFGYGAFEVANSTDPLDYRMDWAIDARSVRYNSHLYSDLYVRDAALIYDWFYPLLTSEQRSQIVHYINRIEGEVWDSENISQNPTYAPWSGWGLTDSGNNYHWSHLLGLTYATIALGGAGENPGQPTVYKHDRLPNPGSRQAFSDYASLLAAELAQDKPFLATHTKGGAWAEGHSYGNYAMSFMMEMFHILRTSQAINLFTESTFPKEAAFYQVYAAQPAADGQGLSWVNGKGIYYNLAGDNPNGFFIRDPDRIYLRQIIEGLGNDPDADTLRAWMQAKFPAMTNSYGMLLGHEFLLDTGATTVGNLGKLAADYFSPGMGWMNSRSTTPSDPNAVSVTFQSGDRIQWHQHEDANAFVVFYKDWQITDAAPYLANVWPAMEAKYHSNVLPDGEEQRMSRMSSGLLGVPDSLNPTGKVLRQESGKDFAYVVGDASDAYYTGVGNYGVGKTRLLNTYIRELLHLRPNLILIYDRVSPVQQTTPISYQIITPKQPVQLNSSDVAATNGAGMVFQRTLLPTKATVNPQQIPDSGPYTNNTPPGVWRTVVKAPDSPANLSFFHLLQTADAGTSAMITTTPISVSNGVMDGVLLATQPANTAVLFAANPGGTALAGGVTYSFTTGTSTTRHLIFNLVPNAGYAISATTGANPQISLSKGGAFLASAAGILDFTSDAQGNINAAPPASNAGALSLNPASLNFAGQNVGSTSPSKTVTLGNPGATPINIAAIQFSGDFSGNHNCGSILVAAASCNMNVSFTPTGSGYRAGSVSITHDGNGSPQSLTLTGTGIATNPYTVNLVTGWNLLGNSVGTAFNVATLFADAGKVMSVWKWLPVEKTWAFYSPQQLDGGAAYAQGKGYQLLITVNGGEGFWVNALAPLSVTLPVISQ